MQDSTSSDRSLPNLEIRVAAINDIPEIVRQRRAMYEDMEYRDADALAAMVSISADYLTKAVSSPGVRSSFPPGLLIPTIWNAAAQRFSTFTHIRSIAAAALPEDSFRQ